MSAKVIKQFPKRFELTEESIRRIYADIKQRAPNENHKDIIFEVFREDSLVYRTAEIDRILSEDNDSTRKIKSIKIDYANNQLMLEIDFDAETGVQLTVAGESRDDVYLLASELREYIDKEIATIRNFKISTPKIMMAILSVMLVSLLFVLKTIAPDTDDESLKAIIASTDPNEKLNYILDSREAKTKTLTPMYLLVAFPILMTFTVIFPLNKLYSYFYPGNIFLFGKQINLVANRRSISKNIFWCGIVSFLIATATGYYFFWLAK